MRGDPVPNLATAATRTADRFGGLPWRYSADDAMFVDGAATWLDCSVDRELKSGDHGIVLFRIRNLDADAEVAPLAFHGSRYRSLAP